MLPASGFFETSASFQGTTQTMLLGSPIPMAVTARNLRVQIGSMLLHIAANTSIAVTLYRAANPAPGATPTYLETALSCTVSTGAVSASTGAFFCSDTADTVALAAGDMIALGVALTAGLELPPAFELGFGYELF